MSYLNQAMHHATNMIAIAATHRAATSPASPVIDIRERFSVRPDHCGNGCPVFRIYDHGIYVDTCWTKSGAEHRVSMLNNGTMTINPHAIVGNRAVAA